MCMCVRCAQVMHSPPLEEHLAQNTLWPEVGRAGGLGFDVSRLLLPLLLLPVPYSQLSGLGICSVIAL